MTMNEEIVLIIKSTLREDSCQYKVFDLLSDSEWHCRSCEGKQVASEQYAGGGGIQGLQRGTKSRHGLVIETKKEHCLTCRKKTTWDRWTGDLKSANAAASIPTALVNRILNFYQFRDVIEDRTRAKHELVIDHRFPMERWGQSETSHDIQMSESDIKQKFQLLKKDDSGNHNLLKSRSCEKCISMGKRATPLGIRFWYFGDEDWNPEIPSSGAEAEQGCVGCGWYDFKQWRDALNQKLHEIQSTTLEAKDSTDSK